LDQNLLGRRVKLINMLKGNMSLVGPRPEVQSYVDMFSEEEKVILNVRPGITDKYFSPPQLYGLMKESFREVKLYGGFPVDNRGAGGEIISLIKRFAVKFKLIPGSLKTRSYLKRIFMGRLVPLPSEIRENMTTYQPPVEIPLHQVNRGFKILYAVGRK
jgi:hypothetical protein